MENNSVTLEQIGNSIKKAHELGDIENAKYLVGKYREMEAELSTAKPKDPNEAGVENLFGEDPGVLGTVGNAFARVLSQPIYEGLVAANVLAEAPAFVGRGINQLWNSVDFYMDDDFNNVFNEQNLKNRQKIAGAIKKKQENNEPVPQSWIDQIKKLHNEKDDGISYADASKLSKIKADELVADTLDKGVLLDSFTNNAIETFVAEPDQQKKVKGVFENFKKQVENSVIIPSAETAFNETISGNLLKAFGVAINTVASGLSAVGVPEETAQSLTEVASLALGPKFAKLNTKVKEATQYIPIRNRIASSAQNVFWQTDKRKAEQSIVKNEKKLSEMIKNKAPSKDIMEAKLKLEAEKGTYNDNQYGVFENIKVLKPWDNKALTQADKDAFNVNRFDIINNPRNKTRKRDRNIPDTKEGLETFKDSALQNSKSNFKADLTAAEVLATRMSNAFGRENGWGPGRTFNKTTERQYFEVQDVIEGTLPKSRVNKFTKPQKELYDLQLDLLSELRKITKKQQKLGLLPEFEIDTKFMPRDFKAEKPGIIENFIGDYYKVRQGDLPAKAPKSMNPRTYFKLESSKGKKPLYITLGENKSGEPIIIVNTAKPGKGGRQDKRAYEPNPDGNYYQQIAYQLTQANKQLDGTGLKNSGDKLNPKGRDLEAMDLGELTLRDVSSAEIRAVYPKEQVLDTLAVLTRSIVEGRQSLNQAFWMKDIMKSAFGPSNFKMAKDYSERINKDKQSMYDPKYPDKNRTISERQKEINKGDDINISQLTSLKFDADAAGLKGWGDMKVSRRVGDILQDNYREFNKSLLGSISDALVKNMMLNPLPHMHNELIHYYSTSGVSKSFGSLFTTKSRKLWAEQGEWAMRQVMDRTPEYQQLIRDGASSMSVNVRNTNAWTKVMQQGTETFWRQQPTGMKIPGKAGLEKISKGYANISNYAQYSMWTMRDVLYMHLLKQKMDKQGISMIQAAKQVELHMPSYRLPETVGPEKLLGYRITRHISRALQNPDWVIFARYKHGMVSSGLNTVKDISSTLDPVLTRTGRPGKFVKEVLGYDNISLGRSKKQQAIDGIDSGLALSSAMYMLYPMMDALYDELFDGDEVKIRRAGILHVLETVGKVNRQETGYDSIRQVLLTINPALMLAYELMMNETMYNGMSIYDINDLTGSGNIEDFASDIGTKLLQTVPQVSTLIHAKDDYEEFDLDKALGRQFDAKIKTPKQSRTAAKRKARLQIQQLNEAIKEGKDLEPYLRDYWENSPYWADPYD